MAQHWLLRVWRTHLAQRCTHDAQKEGRHQVPHGRLPGCTWTKTSMAVGLVLCSRWGGRSDHRYAGPRRVCRNVVTSRHTWEVASDGGLAAWRSNEGGHKRELPTLTCPIEELFLPGHTKQMHLNDPSQIEAIDAARSCYRGLFALVYVTSSDSKPVLPFATVAEITAFTSLDDMGRIITVRGVGRVRLGGKSMVVSTMGGWEAATVEEVPEICSGDAQLVEQAIEEVMQLLASQDISQPGKDATLAGSSLANPANAEDANRPNALGLWTYEQDIVGENFEARWDERITHIAQTMSGVPLSSEEDIAADTWPCMLAGVALLYGLLGATDLATRVEYFTMPDQILTARLRYMLEMLQEKQGMARARRALATMFDSASTEDDGNLLKKVPPRAWDKDE